jgi:hypothetical protein
MSNKQKQIKIKTIAELNAKMVLIAESNGLTYEQFRKLPRKRFIEMCNIYNQKQTK